MMRSILTCLALVAFSAHAEDTRVYQTDAYGNIQYHKPSYKINLDGRVIQTESHGNKLYHKQRYLIKNNKIVPADTYGNRQYNKPALVIEGGRSASANPGNGVPTEPQNKSSSPPDQGCTSKLMSRGKGFHPYGFSSVFLA